MDLRMPGLDGSRALRRLGSVCTARSSVVVLTMFEDDTSVFAAMRAGARGYVLKGADQDEIERAVRAAALPVKGDLRTRDRRPSSSTSPGGDHPRATFPSGPSAKREVLSLIANGRGTRRSPTS